MSAPEGGSKLPDDYFYDVEELRRAFNPEAELPARALKLVHSFAFESGRRYNVHTLDEVTVLFAAGNVVHLYDIVTGQQKYLHGLDGRGIGAVTVHPSRKFFAVGEKGETPNVYVYAYPSLRLYRVLRKGTEQAYTALAFTASGNTLASVGAYPDYMLTVWDWRAESVILRNKAFSQEVYSVAFAPTSDEVLITSGMGHIRFWRMASTFTGLKLQGDIGKFGAVELSDVCAYAILPGGKVISGTEAGRMLLWDGNLIEFEVSRAGGEPCHKGNIEVIRLEGGLLISAGHDGYVRSWDVAQIEAAEVSESRPIVELEPVWEKHVGGEVPTMIVNIVPALGNLAATAPPPAEGEPGAAARPEGDTHAWLVQDGCGALWRFDSEAVSSELVLEFHAGAIVGLETSPYDHFAVTAGADGTVRLWDYVAHRMLVKQGFAAAATRLALTPKSVDAEQRTVAVGFADGTVRVLQRCADSFKLVGAFKPHAAAVTVLAYSPSGHQFATAGADGVVFFFMADAAYTPIGFVLVAEGGAGVSALTWHNDSRRMLVGTTNGCVYELVAPVGEVDTTVSYELSLSVTKGLVSLRALWELQDEYLKPPPPPEAAAPAAAPAPENDGFADQLGEEDDADKGGKEKPKEVELVPVEVRTLAYGPADGYTLTLAGEQLSLVRFECGALSDAEPRGCSTKHPSAITAAATSRTGTLEIVGHADGSVHARRAGDARALWWRGVYHDGERGAVSAVAASWDDEYVLTAGADGNMYVFAVGELPDKPPPPLPPHVPALDTAEEEEETSALKGGVDDIADPAAYSIQEAKLKADHDAREAEAKRRKEAMRREIALIREQFELLRSENEALPSTDRLTVSELEIDRGLRDAAELARRRTLDDARAEMAWDAERAEKQLAKLRAAYLDRLAVEHIELALFNPPPGLPTAVASLRTPHLPGWLSDSVKEVHALLAAELERMGSVADGALREPGAEAVAEWDVRSDADGDAPDALGASADGAGARGVGVEHAGSSSALGVSRLGKGVSDKVDKSEELKARKAARARAWAAFNARKPDDTYEDPQDVLAISIAERQMGDFPLKTDDDYVVPESQRINAHKKRRQMVLLDESIHAIKMGYNERLLALRDLKKRIVASALADDDRLREINARLGEPHTPDRPAITAAELPEERDRLTEDDVDAYQRRLDDQAKRAAGGGFGGGGGGGAAAADKGAGTASGAATKALGAAADAAAAAMIVRRDEPPPAPPSELALAQRELELARLRAERALITRRQARTRETFDSAAAELLAEHLKLIADLQATDMRRLLLFRELQLLKEFEKRDLALAKRLELKRAEKAELVARISECQERLSAKRLEIERLLTKDKEIMAEYNAAVGDNNKNADALQKIFRRKVKRAKKKPADADNDDDDNDEYDSDADDDDDDDDDSDLDDEEEEVCPPGCDPALYDRVCELRLKRLEQEDVYAEFQRSIEALKKDNEALIKKEKALDAALLETDRDIESFQNEKQRKLNELHVVVVLHLSQLRFLNARGQLPADLADCLVFTGDGLERLANRIGELAEEKAELRKRQKELRRKKEQLAKERKGKVARNAELEARAIDVQLLKFGQQVDLDALSNYTVNKGAEELREKVALLEQKQHRALAQWETRLKEAKAELIRATQQSTTALERVAQLLAAQAALEGALNKTQKAGGAVSVPSSGQEDALERGRLVQMVKLQGKEVDALKVEINMLRRKGGHVYSPAPPAPA
ncbi:hypothetical protein KFE25_009950 [Diacronema lutheri]|uniref:Cilia- and flagella-associated protein 44 n=1 Tax=Diacronema lutheri TaxID=2081491 RepID=A0A8J5XMN0_DIALT|nr:hypothetical protein KFE25_009950 [Diacronema lutheri]